MYNSSKKRADKRCNFDYQKEIAGHVFFNDMSKSYIREDFKTCDVIYSEPAWNYGYAGFNDKAGNVPNEYSEYIDNINKLCNELNVPAFVVNNKINKKRFTNCSNMDIILNTNGTSLGDATLYVWNYDIKKIADIKTTTQLVDFLSKEFDKCLDFSCGYGEHLMKFKDFIGCDIDRNCLTYLSILYEEARKNGTT